VNAVVESHEALGALFHRRVNIFRKRKISNRLVLTDSNEHSTNISRVYIILYYISDIIKMSDANHPIDRSDECPCY